MFDRLVDELCGAGAIHGESPLFRLLHDVGYDFFSRYPKVQGWAGRVELAYGYLAARS